MSGVLVYLFFDGVEFSLWRCDEIVKLTLVSVVNPN